MTSFYFDHCVYTAGKLSSEHRPSAMRVFSRRVLTERACLSIESSLLPPRISFADPHTSRRRIVHLLPLLIGLTPEVVSLEFQLEFQYFSHWVLAASSPVQTMMALAAAAAAWTGVSLSSTGGLIKVRSQWISTLLGLSSSIVGFLLIYSLTELQRFLRSERSEGSVVPEVLLETRGWRRSDVRDEMELSSWLNSCILLIKTQHFPPPDMSPDFALNKSIKSLPVLFQRLDFSCFSSGSSTNSCQKLAIWSNLVAVPLAARSALSNDVFFSINSASWAFSAFFCWTPSP